MKKLTAILLVLTMLFAFASCGGKTETPETSTDAPDVTVSKVEPIDTIKVATLSGPTGIGMVKLMSDNENGKTKNKYEFSLCSDPSAEVVPAIVSGKINIASVPLNLAATLYNKLNGDIKILAVNTAGVLYILENGNEINSIADLEGKTIGATGEGSTPEYILKYLLEKNGLKDKVTVSFYASHDELASEVAAGKVSVAMLPEPKVTATLMQNSDVKVALNLTEEFEKITNLTLIQGCVIARANFCDAYPEVVKNFLEEYKSSIEFTASNIEETANLCETFSIIPKAAMAKKAIPNCNIVYIDGEDMKKSVAANLQIFFDADPKSVGGKIPADDFYYAK